MSQIRDVPAFLADFVSDFARAIEVIDSRAPVATNSRSGAPYQPGIGPHTETRTVELVITNLATTDPARYGSRRLGGAYGDGTRQACDLCLGDPAAADWAIEVKMLRLMGDNGKPNDNMIMHILSPYSDHRSALTDCSKLAASGLAAHKAILIYGYDHPTGPSVPSSRHLKR